MSDEKILEILVKKVDGLADDVRSNSFKLDRLEGKLDKVEGKLDNVASDLKLLSGQFTGVAGMAIKDHHPRIGKLEERVDVLEGEVH